MDIDILDGQLKKLQIPIGVSYNYGFLEIIGKETHENTWSKLYAYFLTELENDGKNPMLQALCRIIKRKKGIDLQFHNHKVETEVTTSTGRVDLVISEPYSKCYIIIENKVYHYLHNDLEEYWNFFETEPSKKIGVLLALTEMQIKPSLANKYVAISHIEWLAELEQSVPFNAINDKQSLYLTDFIHTVKQTSKNMNFNEQAKFFFQNTAIVNQAVETMTAAEQFINGQYQQIAAALGLKTYGNEAEWKNFWDEEHQMDVFFTLVTEDLFAGKNKITINIELIRDLQVRYKELDQIIRDSDKFNDKDRGEIHKHYMHLLVKEYELDLTDIENLAEFVLKRIRTDFADIFKAIAVHFYPEFDTYDWVKNLEVRI